jgi:hypothetical protein
MKKPYRDQFGRFTKRPASKKRKKPHVQKTKSYRPPRKPVRKPRRKSVRPLRPTPPSPKRPTHKKTVAPSRKRLPTKKSKEWEDLNNILDSYIEDLDIDEDEIGDYHDLFQIVYEKLRAKKYRHQPSLLVSDKQMTAWKSKPPRMQVWFLVYYHDEGRYNIEFRNWENGDNTTLKEVVDFIHHTFVADQNEVFERERRTSYRHREAIHLIALDVLPTLPPKSRRRLTKVGWTFTPTPIKHKKNPAWKKGTR